MKILRQPFAVMTISVIVTTTIGYAIFPYEEYTPVRFLLFAGAGVVLSILIVWLLNWLSRGN